ncbi:MAG: ABC transporter permease [Bacteroidota bacterium]|nr:ABC transporter permease [Bacteroidota bacterium]
MFTNYIKLAFRNITRYRDYSMINIIGLSIGMAGVLLIFLYVGNELSYDRFHNSSENIYRMGVSGQMGEMEIKGSTSPAPLAYALMEEFDEVIYATKILEGINTVIWYKDKSFFETSYLYADTNFFKVFSFPLLAGDPETALSKPYSMVISRSTAKRYFGNKNPIGEILHEADGSDYTITAVAEDVPENSHFHFDFLASINTYKWTSNNNWLLDQYYTYILLDEDASTKKMNSRLTKFSRKYINPQLSKQFGIDINDWDKLNNMVSFHLEPLTRIYLFSEADPQIEPVSDFRTTYLFAIITLFILFQAILNFSSLTTANSSMRAREIGMRKAMGSQRLQIFFQLLTESVVFSFIAMVFALVMVELFLPTFNRIVIKNLSVSYFKEWFVIPLLLLTTVFIGALAGSYSSLSISAYKTTSTMHGNLVLGNRKLWFRTGLVVFQIFIAVFVITGTLVMYSHISYISKKDPGFDKENVLIIDRAYGLEKGKFEFQKKLESNPNIQHVSITSTVPSMDDWMGIVMRREDASREDLTHFKRLIGDQNMIETFGFEVLKGEFFSDDLDKSHYQVVINETAAENLGYKNPVGKNLIIPGTSYGKEWSFEIVGVLKDFHMSKMNEKIENLAIFNTREFFPRYVSLKFSSGNQQKILSFVEETWKDYAINQPFEFFFLEDKLIEMQFTEKKVAGIFSILSFIAIFIAGIGVISLASFSTESRTREIGIRKAMGSSSCELTQLFLRDFGKWVLIANIFAWPVAYIFLKKWLYNFPYHSDFPYWTLIVAGIFVTLLAFVSVAYQTSKATLESPVKAIRHE